MNMVDEHGVAPVSICVTMMFPNGECSTIFNHDIDDGMISPPMAMAMSLDASSTRLKNWYT